MSWLLALLYLLTGITCGFTLAIIGATQTLIRTASRRLFFRKLASYWPEELEIALGHADVMRPRDTLPEAIQFGTCRHCTLPWPLAENGALIDHPQFDERLTRATCPGSHTHDFLEFE